MPETEIVDATVVQEQTTPPEPPPGGADLAQEAAPPAATEPSTAVAVIEGNAGAIIRAEEPREILRKAREIAIPLAELIESAGLSVALDRRNPRRKHVEVGGWQATGALLGALGGQPLHGETVWTRPARDPATGEAIRRTYTATVERKKWGNVDGRRQIIETTTTTYDVDGYDWEARVEIRTPGGVVVGIAEAMVSRTEETWNRRDEYALRSMAETRAESRAWRKATGWIVHLAGYNPTPAEEMGHTPGADTEPAAAAGPPFGPAIADESVVKLRRAIALLAGTDPQHQTVGDVIAALEKDAGGYLPRIVGRALMHIAAATRGQTSAVATPDTSTGDRQDASPPPVAATDPAAATFPCGASYRGSQTLRCVLSAGHAGQHQGDAGQKYGDDMVAAPAEAPAPADTSPAAAHDATAAPVTPPTPPAMQYGETPVDALKRMRDHGCVCKQPFSVQGAAAIIDDTCPIHGIPF